VQSGLTAWRLGTNYASDSSSCGGWAFAEYAVLGRVLNAEEVAALYHRNAPLVDTGAYHGPGLFILDGHFSLSSSTSGARIEMDEEGYRAFSAESGNPQSIALDSDGDVFFGSDISAAATTALAVFANAQAYNSESVGAGDILFGDNSFSKANILWDKSEGQLLFRQGTITIFEIMNNRLEFLNAGGDSVSYLSGNSTGGGVMVNAPGLSIVSDHASYSRSLELLAISGTDVNGISAEAGAINRVNVFVGNERKVAFTETSVEVDYDTDVLVSGGISVGSLFLDPEVGVIWVNEIASTPGNPTSGADVKIYMKSDKLIFQYNDGGTVRYKYISLSGTGVTWTHTTSAP
jgi:hypothetical protein